MRKIVYVFILILVFALLSGCDGMSSNAERYSTNNSFIDKVTFIPPENESVEWITMTGGLGGITTKVMFSGHDDTVIKKIVDMIRQNKEMYSMENKYIEAIFPKIRPIGLVISLNGGDCYYLWPSYEIVNHADGWTVTTLTDRFTLQIDTDGNSSYFTIFSKEVTDYLINGWKNDMPEVEDIKIESGTAASNNKGLILRNGDALKVSGDGCPYSDVDIYIRKNGDKEVYNLGNVKTEFGIWQWEGFITRHVNKSDGNAVRLEDGLYDIVVVLGEREKAICGAVRFN